MYKNVFPYPNNLQLIFFSYFWLAIIPLGMSLLQITVVEIVLVPLIMECVERRFVFAHGNVLALILASVAMAACIGGLQLAQFIEFRGVCFSLTCLLIGSLPSVLIFRSG